VKAAAETTRFHNVLRTRPYGPASVPSSAPRREAVDDVYLPVPPEERVSDLRSVYYGPGFANPVSTEISPFAGDSAAPGNVHQENQKP
jgi:hypothetical protein